MFVSTTLFSKQKVDFTHDYASDPYTQQRRLHTHTVLAVLAVLATYPSTLCLRLMSYPAFNSIARRG